MSTKEIHEDGKDVKQSERDKTDPCNKLTVTNFIKPIEYHPEDAQESKDKLIGNVQNLNG